MRDDRRECVRLSHADDSSRKAVNRPSFDARRAGIKQGINMMKAMLRRALRCSVFRRSSSSTTVFVA